MSTAIGHNLLLLVRWEFCELTTERFFRHLITSMYALDMRQSAADHAETEQRQKVAKKLFDYIKHNVMKSVTLSNSYDYPTRRAALDKLKNMTVQIGTPDFLMDKAYLKVITFLKPFLFKKGSVQCLERFHETARIFTRIEKTLVSARSFSVIIKLRFGGNMAVLGF